MGFSYCGITGLLHRLNFNTGSIYSIYIIGEAEKRIIKFCFDTVWENIIFGYQLYWIHLAYLFYMISAHNVPRYYLSDTRVINNISLDGSKFHTEFLNLGTLEFSPLSSNKETIPIADYR